MSVLQIAKAEMVFDIVLECRPINFLRSHFASGGVQQAAQPAGGLRQSSVPVASVQRVLDKIEEELGFDGPDATFSSSLQSVMSRRMKSPVVGVPATEMVVHMRDQDAIGVPVPTAVAMAFARALARRAGENQRVDIDIAANGAFINVVCKDSPLLRIAFATGPDSTQIVEQVALEDFGPFVTLMRAGQRQQVARPVAAPESKLLPGKKNIVAENRR